MKKGAFASLFVITLTVTSFARLIPEVVWLTLTTAVIVLCATACLGGYLYRRKMQREGKWPVEGKPAA